jgi:hypothetical protein
MTEKVWAKISKLAILSWEGLQNVFFS